MKAKKYLGSILAASLLFGLQVRAQDVEQKETKEEEIVKKIENKTEENVPVVQEEAKNQDGVCTEEKGNALAYTLIAAGGVVAGWVGTAIVKGCQENKIVNAYKKDAVNLKTIFGMTKEALEKKQLELDAKKDVLIASQVPDKKDAAAIKKIKTEIAICQTVLDAQQKNEVEAVLKRELDELALVYLNKNVESLIKKFDDAKTEVLKPEAVKVEAVKVGASVKKDDKTVVSAPTVNPVLVNDGDKKDEPKKDDKKTDDKK